MMKPFCIILLQLLCCLTLQAAALEAEHDPETGLTTLHITCENKHHFHQIRRSRTPLSATAAIQAEEQGDLLENDCRTITIPARENGTACYYLFSCNTLRQNPVFEAAAAPIEELDRTPPTPPVLFGEYRQGKPLLHWRSAPAHNPEGLRCFRLYRSQTPEKLGVLLVEIEKTLTRRQEYHDASLTASAAFYRLTAIDGAGNESTPSNPVASSLLPDLSLGTGERVSVNACLSTSKMYPRVGESVTFTASIQNRGATASSPVSFTVQTENGELISKQSLPAIAPGEEKTVEWRYVPSRAGEYSMQLTIDPENKARDAVPGNNVLILRAAAVEKDVHFVWYGNVLQLPYANHGQCPALSSAEWRRRGGLAMALAGTGHNALEEYSRLAASGQFDGIVIDEIFRFTEAAQRMAVVLPELRKAFPDFKIALWTIGEDTAPEIADLVKAGVIDLLMFEVYVKPGEPVNPIYRAAENIQKRGIADKSLIGLVTHKTWNNWHSPEQQAESVIAQLHLIRSIAADIPGAAFWSDDAQPGVIEAVDQACYELFILGKTPQPEKFSRMLKLGDRK